MKPDSIILDIDGTLWNSTPIVADAWNKEDYVQMHTDIYAPARSRHQLRNNDPFLPEKEKQGRQWQKESGRKAASIDGR